jgi:hypothetical protein
MGPNDIECPPSYEVIVHEESQSIPPSYESSCDRVPVYQTNNIELLDGLPLFFLRMVEVYNPFDARYSFARNRFNDREFPSELTGLIPPPHYSRIIKAINKELFDSFPKDHVRTGSLGGTCLFAATFFFLLKHVNRLMAFSLDGIIFLLVYMLAIGTFHTAILNFVVERYWKGRLVQIEKFLKLHENTSFDEMIGIQFQWKLSKKSIHLGPASGHNGFEQRFWILELVVAVAS